MPLQFQNQSLVVHGQVRTLISSGSVRALKVRLGEELSSIARDPIGWKKSGEGWVGFHFSQNFQSPQFIPKLRASGVNFLRTTLVEKNGQCGDDGTP